MAKRKRIIWTPIARKQKLEILEYWLKRNHSNSYPKKLNELFNTSLELISLYPKLGRPTDIDSSVRVKSLKNYDLFYKISNKEIVVLTIWDNRRNPDKLKLPD